MQRKLLFILLALMIPSAWAAAIGSTTPKTMTIYCPKPSNIKKNQVKLTWSADRNTFRSYDISFSTRIEKFTGAQWNGASVGQITCIYQTLPKPTFPLLLIFHTLTFDPVGGAWSKDLGGYKNCNSFDRKQCGFKVRLKAEKENIYQEAESLKSMAPEPPNE